MQHNHSSHHPPHLFGPSQFDGGDPSGRQRIFDYNNFYQQSAAFAVSVAAPAAYPTFVPTPTFSGPEVFPNSSSPFQPCSHPAQQVKPHQEIFAWMKDFRGGKSRARNPDKCGSSSSSHNKTPAGFCSLGDLVSSRRRTNYSTRQQVELEKEFHTNRYLTKARRTELSEQLSLSERQIKIWFQNRRMKLKRWERHEQEPKLDRKAEERETVVRMPAPVEDAEWYRTVGKAMLVDGVVAPKLETPEPDSTDCWSEGGPALVALQNAFQQVPPQEHPSPTSFPSSTVLL